MSLLSRTTNIARFNIVGGQLPADVAERLSKHRFRPINNTADPLSVGWVPLLEPDSDDFSGAARDRYVAFSLRIDRRKIPGAILRQHIEKANKEWLEQHPGLQRVPKLKREEIRETVLLNLYSRTLPAPAIYDAIIDLEANTLTLATHNRAATELFEALFKTTFEGLRLSLIHPFAFALSVLPEPFHDNLNALNKASSESVLDLMRENEWIGEDFLLWLAHKDDNQEHASSQNGGFYSWLDKKVVMIGSDGEALQKVTSAGPCGRFQEIKAALRAGKVFIRGAVCMMSEEEEYSLVLDAGSFRFASVKTPSVKIEKTPDPESERMAVFFERMFLLEKSMDLFSSLFRDFLILRTNAADWRDRINAIEEWKGEE